jgi:hypothetical protein
VGVLGPEALADTLRNCGADVVGGPKFVTAALALRQHPDSGDVFPLIVVRQEASGFDRWLDKHAGQTRTMVFGTPAPGSARSVSAGDRLADVCAALGLDLDVDRSIVFDTDGDVTIAEDPAPPPAPEPNRPPSPPVGAQPEPEPATQPFSVIADSHSSPTPSVQDPTPAAPDTAPRITDGGDEHTSSPPSSSSVGWSDTNQVSNVGSGPQRTGANHSANIAPGPLSQTAPPNEQPPTVAPSDGGVDSLVAEDYIPDGHTDQEQLLEGDDPYVDRRRGQLGDLLIPLRTQGRRRQDRDRAGSGQQGRRPRGYAPSSSTATAGRAICARS